MKLKVTQIRSLIGRQEHHKRVIKALGLGKIGKSRIHNNDAVTLGMIDKVKFLVKVETLDEKQ